jgi:uncharacterized protein (DUF2147 family)
MKHFKIWIIALSLTLSSQLFAQKSTEAIIGKWLTEDYTILEIFKIDNSICIKQLSTNKEKEKISNGKLIGKNLVTSNNKEYNGIVIDPSNSKEYKGLFTLSADGKSLNLKVKWAFINFNETWRKL